MRSTIPQWRLPPGVTPGLWDYTQSHRIADDYDDYFAYNQLFSFDEKILLQHFVHPGTLLDLGCGTGRLLAAFARRGFHAIGVDLSHPMLRVAGGKAASEQLPIDRVLANMVELDCFADRSADYCICMFNTLGMVSEACNRRKVVEHARRVLRPGGQFAIHVHNRWSNLFDPQGRLWLLSSLFASKRQRLEPGDIVFEYRGIPNVRLHLFTRSELLGLLRAAGFRLRMLIPLDTDRQQPLGNPWWLGRFRANGWIAICD